MAHHLFHNSCLVYIARYQLSDKHVPMCALTRLAVGFRRMMSWSCLKHHFLQFLLNYIFLSKFFLWKLNLYFSVIIYLKKLNTINTCMQIRTLKYSTHIFLKLKLRTCTWVPQLLFKRTELHWKNNFPGFFFLIKIYRAWRKSKW